MNIRPVALSVFATLLAVQVSAANQDMIFANVGKNRICLNNGGGSITCSDIDNDTSTSNGAGIGFINSDAFADILFANNGVNRYCTGDGLGGFLCTFVSADANDSTGVAVADLNGDTRLDAVFSNRTGTNRVCLGNGNGFSGCSDVSADTNTSFGVALGDMDGDGNLDAMFANNGPNRLCLGNGSGGFSGCANAGPDAAQSVGVALGDVDADGNLDAVFANFLVRNRSCLGDGAGAFTCSDVSTDTNGNSDVALGLVNAGGNLDAMFTNGDLSSTVENIGCFGDGAGGYTCSNAGTSMDSTSAVAIGPIVSVDNDVVFANTAGFVSPPTRSEYCVRSGGSWTCTKFGTAKSSKDVALGAVRGVCGDGTLDLPQEQCDDGNTSPGDCCTATCQFEPGQGMPGCCSQGACQTGQGCGAICFTPGGGCLQSGGLGTPCTCVLPVCGNSIIEFGEECDDGNVTPGDGCDALCLIEHSCIDEAVAACNAWQASGGSNPCFACTSEATDAECIEASVAGCANPVENGECAAGIDADGCAEVCGCD